MATQFTGGFTAPPIESAEIFRSVLTAMSRPGTPVDLNCSVRPPSPLSVETAAVLLTLCDADTPLWVAPDLAAESVLDWLRFHTSAPLVEVAAKAAFAAVSPASPLESVCELSIGTPEYPDRAATVILQLSRLGTESTLALTGPGIESAAWLDASDLPSSVLPVIDRNRQLYPLGIDLLITAPGKVVGVPRSSAVGSVEVT